MEEPLQDLKYGHLSSVPAGNLLVKGPSLNNNMSIHINSTYQTVEEVSLRQSIQKPNIFDSLSGSVSIGIGSLGLAAGVTAMAPLGGYVANHSGSLCYPPITLDSSFLAAGAISPSDSYLANHSGSLCYPPITLDSSFLAAGVISPSDSYLANHSGSLCYQPVTLDSSFLAAGVISPFLSNNNVDNPAGSLYWPSISVDTSYLVAAARSLSQADNYVINPERYVYFPPVTLGFPSQDELTSLFATADHLVSSSDFSYQNQRVAFVGHALSFMGKKIRGFRDFLLGYREINGADEIWEKLSGALQWLVFCRGFANESFVKTIAFIAKISKVQLVGKGIEGFIAYKTWARPPCDLDISIIIDIFSRPGYYSWEINYA